MKFDINRRRPLPAILGLVVLGGGCGQGDVGPKVHPVSGKVLVDGKPAAKARLTFHPTSAGPSKAPSPYAETDAEGSFRPSTRLTHDGAPVGDYTLTVVWPDFKVDHGEEIAGMDRLAGRYGDPDRSKLKVTIKEGENALPPLELKASGPWPGPSTRAR